MTLAYCWAHCRRRFFEIAKERPAPIAREALQRIAALYAIEAEIRGRSADERRAARQERTKPLIDALRSSGSSSARRGPRKSPLAEAIRYALNHWEGSTASSTTAGSRSTPTRSSARSGRSPSIARTRCSPATTSAPRTGRCSPR